ncbi:family S53 protease-like protein [Cristinia sonorae]|uniref:tripeptidyl-peptidase II n=1 Tax=Cristinia sonorae TaxID=1940300 RepID=A0A8K0UED8_9AGAR|nr:family S53 protease-like protein [Cristinia sonorae]
MLTTKLIVLSLLSFAWANPLGRRALKLHESRATAPDGFVKTGAAAPDTKIKLRIALAQSNPQGLTDALMAVSEPDSALYGQHLSQQEVDAFVAPKPETVAAVNEWLSENGLTAQKLTTAGNWISFEVPVSKANELLNTQFAVFKHEDSGEESVRTLEYSIPANLVGHVNLVHPTITFPNPTGQLPVFSIPGKVPTPAVNLTSDAVPASCANTVTPACVQALYNVPTTKATQSSNVLGVSGFIQQFANQADLRSFLTNLRPDVPATTTFTLQTLDGGQNPQGINQAGIEANLDIQYTIGIATGVPTTFISVGNNFRDGALEGFLDIINFLNGEASPPHVLTTSYGQNENTISSNLANELCTAYQQLGARGTSILFASGDGGVAGSQSSRCTNFLPTFPSGCPFMTSVGATTGVPETSAPFSSGGFSNVFAQPSYQSAAVSRFLSTLGNTNSGKFNRAGRGFPDVAAIGDNVEIAFQNQFGLVAGTSCSSPIFASLISLINDRLIAKGKSPLGFLNPFLYANPQAFNDITTGNNPGCNTNGFPAVSGWDPVTGLGTPNFPALLAAAGAN